MKKRMILTAFCMMTAGAAFLAAPIQPAAAASASPANSAKICSTCNTPYKAFGPVPDFRGDPYSSSWGQCVWWAAIKRLDERFKNLGGLAYQWAANAARHGFKTGTTPRVGATVIFQRGVDGASWWGGHAAHVEKLYSGGWFLISEMNFYAHGGGWDRVSYRYVHVGPGVSFIY